MRVIGFASGKGGVGKTTIVANLAILMSKWMKVIVVDADVFLPNLHAAFGLRTATTLSDVLTGNVDVEMAIYSVSTNLHVMPASPAPNLKIDRLSEVIDELKKDYDRILIDFSAGLSKMASIPMESADILFLITNPEKASLVSAQKVKKIGEELGVKGGGVILNRYAGEKELFKVTETMLGRIVGLIRESKYVAKSWEIGKPFVVLYPNSGITKDLVNTMLNITGQNRRIKPYGKLWARLKGD
jgi:MinD-like ATPase involved in chromosome partitioning or flagellar assembly